MDTISKNIDIRRESVKANLQIDSAFNFQYSEENVDIFMEVSL